MKRMYVSEYIWSLGGFKSGNIKFSLQFGSLRSNYHNTS